MESKTPFPTDYQEIIDQIDSFNPMKYGATRNFLDGHVSRLSPYISRGVISTREVLQRMRQRYPKLSSYEKFIQELAWRDYWQVLWRHHGTDINTDLRQGQPAVTNHQVAKAIIDAETGIVAIDEGITELYDTGYMHNHMRMYVASIATNVAGSHWLQAARWMYYHLYDGDWASNALSWQWVAGANSSKKYYANQDNINKYCNSKQKRTFLDVSYDQISQINTPDVLADLTLPQLTTTLPDSVPLQIEPDKPILIYNYYNLDPLWHRDEEVNRIFLWEPSIFERYPISQSCVDFAMELSKNIDGLQVYVGKWSELKALYPAAKYVYKEHPLNQYEGTEEPREWMSGVDKVYRSFFGFWKKAKKEIMKSPDLFDQL